MSVRATHAKRKLLPRQFLKELSAEEALGVPVKLLVRKYQLDLSSVHLGKLIAYYNTCERVYVESIFRSLYPDWLTTEHVVQVQPKGFMYAGVFPFGEWLYENN